MLFAVNFVANRLSFGDHIFEDELKRALLMFGKSFSRVIFLKQLVDLEVHMHEPQLVL